MTDRVATDENTQFKLGGTPKFTFMDNGAEGEKRKRTFSGVAYTGEMIVGHWHWGNLVFDLGSITSPINKPILLDHDSGQRCGYITDTYTNNEEGLVIKGPLLSNEFGKQVQEDSDEGFPWQMSVRIDPDVIEEVQAGSEVLVNGRTFHGPVTVFRNSTIAEVSFTATGWDDKTSATALSKLNASQSKEQEMSMTTEEQSQLLAATTAVTTLTNEKLTAETAFANEQAAHEATKAELTEFKNAQKIAEEAKRNSDIAEFAKETKQEIAVDSDLHKQLFSLDAASFKTMTDMVKTNSSKKASFSNDSNLFSHEANGEVTSDANNMAKGGNALVANAKSRAEKK